MKNWRLYTGPVHVSEVAESMREAGIEGVVEGTEHVYFTFDLRGEELDPIEAKFEVIYFLREKGVVSKFAGIRELQAFDEYKFR